MTLRGSKLVEGEKLKKPVTPFNATLMKAPLSPISENKTLSLPFRWFISLSLTFQVSLYQTPPIFSPRTSYGFDLISPIAPKRLSFPTKDEQNDKFLILKKVFSRKNVVSCLIVLLVVVALLSVRQNSIGKATNELNFESHEAYSVSSVKAQPSLRTTFGVPVSSRETLVPKEGKEENNASQSTYQMLEVPENHPKRLGL